MSRNAISANSEHYIFKIFRGSMPPDPLEGQKKIFLTAAWLKNFFQDRLPPKQKILDGTLTTVDFKKLVSDLFHSGSALVGRESIKRKTRLSEEPGNITIASKPFNTEAPCSCLTLHCKYSGKSPWNQCEHVSEE